jgi:molybdate transport system substrate-binding protein
MKMKRKRWLTANRLIPAIIMAGLLCCPHKGLTKDTLLVYSGAGMRKPMDKIGVAFEKKYGVPVTYNYAGSTTLLSQIALTKKGDCYMPGATLYIEKAKEKGFIDYQKPVAYHIPIIAVPKGNSAKIKGLTDLAKPGIRIILGDPKVAACGKIAKKILEKNKIYNEVEKNVVAYTATANELVVYVCMGQADAIINWKASMLGTEDKADIVEIPKEQNCIKVIPIGRLTFSQDKKMSKEFVDFVTSSQGTTIFESCGFTGYPNPKYEKKNLN